MLFPPFVWSQLWTDAPQGSRFTHRKAIALRRFAGPDRYAGKMQRLRIAHLTDLHVGRVTPMRLQREAMALTNGEAPDLVVDALRRVDSRIRKEADNANAPPPPL